MFNTNQKESFSSREERVLDFWNKKEIFAASLKAREKGPLFSFYDGPPFATGLPHYGHLLAGTIKDVVPRFKTMQGYYVPRRFGWDCHGLPVENEIEKAQELSGGPEIEKFGIDKFNEECRSIVLRYTEEWKSTVSRMGRWVDFDKTYRTMDASFMESVWWAFSQAFAKGLVYEGFKVMPYSAKLGTPLSNFEANLNYQDVDDPSLTVILPLVSDPRTALLAWTTTPWTLPSNLALAVGPDIDYVKVHVKESDQFYILAKARLGAYFKNPEEYEIIEEMKGSALAGKHYEPLFPHFAHKKQESAFQVLVDDFVSTEDGTGIVHMAPAFGEADFFICTAAGIELVCPVDQNGKFTKEIPEYEGMFVKDADKEIIKRLKDEKRVFLHTQIRHRYPFCWRSDTPLIYRAMRTWFVSVEKIKDRLLKNNEEIHWVPGHIKHGRFGKWLENARDWAISRNRYWGTPIPIWRSEDGEVIVINSVKELEKRTGQKITDLHRHFIDDLTFEENGKTFKRIPEVFDCWFESGAMPYAQNHYPFANEEETMQAFPADFIAEGLDQTRGWFYTLNVLSTILFDKPAFKNVIVNGIILAEDGNKMSKRLKNYPDPGKVIDEYGADSIRLFLLGSGAVEADDLRFSERGVEQVTRSVLIPFWNAHVFLSTYATIYKWAPTELTTKPTADIDRWILSLVQKLIEEVTGAMERYELRAAVTPFVAFIDSLTNWYIRRCRTRFWADEDSPDRREAFSTLYQVLLTLSKIAAPFVPFLTEAIYLQLRKETDPESVHLCDFPLADEALRDEELEREMASAQIVVSNAHALRKEHKLKVRQPLQAAHVITADDKALNALKRQENLIAEELNVHKVEFSSNEEEFVALICKPNFRVLGKKVGPKMRVAQGAIKDFDQKQMATLLNGKTLDIELEGETFTLTPEDVAVEREVREGLVARSEEGITVALDTELTEDLLLEGIARELINKINTMRRDAGFAVTDRIEIGMETTDRVKKALTIHQELIMNEVLGVSLTFEAQDGTEWDINGEKTKISLLLAEKTQKE
ncbi:MAG: isoleucine--tRNA ligase [Simkaniaceae bacterium]|nr:isoleucine--tRNA ligase [Candidatus Sacchlamyda saccharinae]